MAKANVPVEFSPVDSRKVESALARIQSQAKGVNFGKGAESINKLSRPLGKITGQASEFQKSLEASNARVLAFGASVAVINKLSEAFGALVNNTVKVEAAFAKINTILGGTQKQIEEFGNGIFKVAQRTATSFDQVAEGALELARQGLSVSESLSRVETSLKLVRVAGIDSKEAVAGLTAAIKGFEGAGLTVAAIGDKLAEVDTKFAVSTEDLINGLERASASARVAGVSLDELLAVVTTVQERTQRGGAVIGNAFKTIFARLGRTDTLKTLEDLGINVLDTSGNVRNAIPLFQELATELNKLGLRSVEAGEVIQKVAGVRQRDILISLVEDLNSSQSQFAKALNISATAAGSLDSKNAKLNDTLEALINNLTVGGQKLASVIGELGFTEGAKDLLKLFGNIVNSITDILQGESIGSKFAQGLIKGIGATLTPGIALVGAIFIKLFVDLAKFGVTSLKQILGINKAAQAQNALQQSVLQTLLQNEAIQKEILALEGNKVAQEQLLLKIYNQQAAALARVQKAAASVTPGLFGAGLRGGERGVTRRAAGGYVAAEARDVSRGVGGAPSSSKVVSIPNFAFGGGKHGTMVANTSEYYVPNYKGGGDAIFNRDMVRSMGLPSGAKKLNAAGGYVPNFNKNIYISRGTSTQQLQAKAKQGDKDAQEALAIRAGRGGNAFNAESKGVVMLVPQTTVRGTSLDTVFKKPKVGKKGTYNSFIGKAFGIDPNLSKDSKFANLVGIDGQLESAMADSINTIIGKVYPSIKTSPTPPISAKAAKQKFLQEGGAGAFGSFRGAMFEAIIEMIVGGSRGDNAGTLDVAFNSANTTALNEIFGLPRKYSFGDYKNSVLSKGKFIDQAIANRGAGGYIPNFFGGALEEAISRENKAGVPLNQIRVNQSGKLRNAQNPKGLAVTNTRDEPTGAIPNFQKGDNSGGLGGGIAGIFIVQALGGMVQSFVDAESAIGKLVRALTTAATAFASISLIAPSITKASKSLTVFGNALRRRAARDFLAGGAKASAGTVAKSVAGRAVGLGGRALGMLGPVGMIASIAVPLIAELSKTKTGFEELNQAMKNIDLSGLQLGTAEDVSAFMKALNQDLGDQAQQQKSAEELGARPGQTLNQRINELVNGLEGVPKSMKGEGEQGEFLRKTVGFLGAEDTQKLLNQALITPEQAASKKVEQSAAKEGFGAFLNNLFGGPDAEAIEKRLEEEAQIDPAILFDPEAFKKLVRDFAKSSKKVKEATKSADQLAVEEDPTKRISRLSDRLKVASARGASARFTSDKFTQSSELQLKLAGSLSQLDRQRLEAQSAILQFELKKTEQLREQGVQLGTQVATLIKGKAVNKEQEEAIISAVEKGAEYSEILQLINDLKEGGVNLNETETKLLQDTLDSFEAKETSLNAQLDLEKDILDIRKKQAELSPLDAANQRRREDLKDLEQNVPARLADNLENSIGNAMNSLADGTYDSLGDVFLNIALDFGRALQEEISSAVAKNLVQSFTSSGAGQSIFKGIGSIFSTGGTGGGSRIIAPNASGGLVTGGTGVMDDIPAKLTGGEYVIKKSAVQKYGPDFLDRLNSGAIQGMQYGGTLATQGADNVRTGRFFDDTAGYMAGGARSRAYLEEAKKRDFFVPGQRGFGDIVGKENLLAFSQQRVTSGSTDVISNRVGGASINLEDQSARLTAFGRRRESPAKRALEDAQAQAFDLYGQSVAEEQRVVQENRDAKTARRKAFQQAVVGAFVNATMAGVSAGINNVDQGGSFFGTGSTESLKLGEYGISDMGVGPLKPGASIANIPGATGRVKTGSFLGFDQFKIAPTDFGASLLDRSGGAVGGGGSMFNASSYLNYAPPYQNTQRRSNGGLMSGGGSSANALLMDGEYVMGSESASSLGRDTLDSINSMNFANGGPVGGSTMGSSSGADVGTLNIEINIEKDGNASASASGSGEQDPEKAKEFSKKIKDVVLNVINEEKRVSGSLFTRNK